MLFVYFRVQPYYNTTISKILLIIKYLNHKNLNKNML